MAAKVPIYVARDLLTGGCMKDDTFYISRNYVEFGPFSAKELKLFYQRGTLKVCDHISADGSTWQTLAEWLAVASPSTPAPAAKRKRAAAAPKKSTPAPAPVKKRKRAP